MTKTMETRRWNLNNLTGDYFSTTFSRVGDLGLWVGNFPLGNWEAYTIFNDGVKV